MFESAFGIGRIRGIRIQVHYTWIVIFALLSLSLIAHFRAEHTEWSQAIILYTAFATVLLFFTSIVLHELGHSLVALRRGVPVRSITLFIFGGVAQLEKDSETARDEFWIAIAGPLVSFGLAFVFYLLAALTHDYYQPASTAFGWLAFINLLLGTFNMLPGFPLDGGRVFRAVIWGLTGDARKGILWAVRGGRYTAYALMALGGYVLMAHGNLIGGLWFAAIGWFLLNAAEASGQELTVRQVMGDMRAADLMDRHPPLIRPNTSIREWVEERVLPTGARAALVAGDREPAGLVSLSDTRAVARHAWQDTPVEQVMTPRDKLQTVEAGDALEQVLRLLGRHNLNQVPVISEGRIVGWIDRQQLLRNMQIRMEVASEAEPGR